MFLQQLFAPNYRRLLRIQKIIYPFCFPATTKKQKLEYSFTLVMQLKSGIKCALIKTVDTDIVAIAFSHFLDLEIDELWVEFEAGKK